MVHHLYKECGLIPVPWWFHAQFRMNMPVPWKISASIWDEITLNLQPLPGRADILTSISHSVSDISLQLFRYFQTSLHTVLLFLSYTSWIFIILIASYFIFYTFVKMTYLQIFSFGKKCHKECTVIQKLLNSKIPFNIFFLYTLHEKNHYVLVINWILLLCKFCLCFAEASTISKC